MPVMRSRPILICALFCAAVLLGTLIPAAAPAQAQQFRSGHVTWTPGAGNDIDLTVYGAFRRSDFECFDPATFLFVPCSEPDGYPGVGDVFEDFIGLSFLNFGDGMTTGVLMFMVTDMDIANDWVYGVALDSNSFPSIDTTIGHTYAATGDYVASLEGCCRLFETLDPNSHINNPNGAYRVETMVNVGSGNSSPVSTVPHLVNCPPGAECNFTINATDPDADPLSFRLAMPVETGDMSFVQPGAPHAPNAASVDSVTGLYTWDTTGALDASDIGAPATNTLYSTQVMVEEGASRVAMDFMIQLVADDGAPPVITLAEGAAMVDCGSTLFVDADDSLMVTISAMGDDLLTLEADILPGDAMFLPALPLVGNPVGTMLSWTPGVADEGVHQVMFTATDAMGRQSMCALNIEVMAPDIPEPPVEDPPVAVDVMPGACPNALRAVHAGVVPVAIAGTADFDVTTVDPSTVLLEGVPPMRVGHDDVATPFMPFLGKSEPTDCTDEGADGFGDLVLHFDRGAVLDALGPMVHNEVRILRLTGNLTDGTPISGEDVVVLLMKGETARSPKAKGTPAGGRNR